MTVFDEISQYVELLNKLKENEKHTLYISQIYSISNYLLKNDIYNGLPYLYKVMEDEDVKSNMIFASNENTSYNQNNIPNFASDCYAVIRALGITILKDKENDELKKHLPNDLKSLTEIMEFVKENLKQNKE